MRRGCVARVGWSCAWTMTASALGGLAFAVSSCALDQEAAPGNAPASAQDASDARDAGEAGGGADASGFPGSKGDADASSCVQGSSCGDGGVCAGGMCCEASRACAEACCSAGQLCSFGKCVLPGAWCLSDGECAAQEYCEPALGTISDAGVHDAALGLGDGGACHKGRPAESGRCLPKPPLCAGTGTGSEHCLQPCEYHPAAPELNPVLKYSWGAQVTAPWQSDVMMTPIVIQLDDDDCDGKVTATDIPEIVFTTHSNGQYQLAGPMHAISIVQGKVVEKWTFPGIAPSTQLAAGNFDGKPGNEIVACLTDGKVQSVTGNGKALWTSETISCVQPAIADLNGDGKPEIVVDGGILDGATGAVQVRFTPAMEGTFLVSDLDSDGTLDIVSANRAYRADGSVLADTGVTGFPHGAGFFQSGPAMADLDRDGKPEVLAVYYRQHALSIWRYAPAAAGKAEFIRKAIDINGSLSQALCPHGQAGNQWGGGPATVGDFNGDGTPDVALAGGVGYAVLDGAKLMNKAVADADTFLWVKQTHDCSSAGTGSSLFDFNGDGKSEVVYSDEYYLRIYEGATGKVLFETCNTTHTLNEYPVIADVDNDGQADIVAVSNAHNAAITCEGKQQSGVRIFGSAGGTWVRTRRVWNQHAYHITNVEEDGTIPVREKANWLEPKLNNFRLNRQPGNLFSAPDAVVRVEIPCSSPVQAVATVRNMGESVLAAGVTVEFYAGPSGTGKLLGKGTTELDLYPAQAERVLLTIPAGNDGVAQGRTGVSVRAVVPAAYHECRPANNESGPAVLQCSVR